MKYKLIASDYDRTLSDDIMGVSDYTKSVIHKYIDNGGRFVISTGRIYKSILPKVQELKLKGELICYQGAATYDIESGELLNIIPMKHNNSIRVLKFIENLGLLPQAYTTTEYYIPYSNDYTDQYAAFCAVKGINVMQPLSEYFMDKELELLKIIILMDENLIKSIIDKIYTEFKDTFNISQSHKNFLEIVSVDAGKGNAIKILADKYSIKREEVMAFGDATNDLSMIEYAGMGVAVGNAMQELKDAADYISENVEDDGVAKTIVEFCFNVKKV